MKNFIVILIAGLLLSACLAPKTRTVKIEQEHVKVERQKQQELALLNLRKLNIRLKETAYPLLQSALTFCEDDQIPLTGMILGSQFDYTEDFRETAENLFQLDQHLRVIHIIEDSPADKAGIQKHDRLVAVNNTVLPTDKSANKRFNELVKQVDSSAIPLTFARGEASFSIDIDSVPGCNYPALLSENDGVNAFADGDHIIITKGMMRFAQTDQELSLVISHELAHNAMSHINAKTLNSLGGTLLDIAAAAAGVNTQGIFGRLGSRAYSQEFESEADYVGLYIMARAGLSTENSAMFWRRMAVEHPASINSSHASTHPATAERFIAIEKTVVQIDEKKQQGIDLLPEMKQ
jgi:hypothetical protein